MFSHTWRISILFQRSNNSLCCNAGGPMDVGFIIMVSLKRYHCEDYDRRRCMIAILASIEVDLLALERALAYLYDKYFFSRVK